jgi:8-oxo-dGTP pyrophosphatase MutT (NUDIX family)
VADKPVRYVAAGGVIVDGDRVLVLDRPGRAELRLPKGHLEEDETVRQAALREATEESGYTDLVVLGDLGSQCVEFDYKGRHVARVERYFLMRPTGPGPLRAGSGEAQFDPVWMTWDEALDSLTFEAEREWVRRARQASEKRLAGQGQ